MKIRAYWYPYLLFAFWLGAMLLLPGCSLQMEIKMQCESDCTGPCKNRCAIEGERGLEVKSPVPLP